MICTFLSINFYLLFYTTSSNIDSYDHSYDNIITYMYILINIHVYL